MLFCSYSVLASPKRPHDSLIVSSSSHSTSH